jgi:hypothetical protein
MNSARLCLNDLEALASERDAGKRRELLRRVTDLFFMTASQQSEIERGSFGGVMERVAYQLESEARAELSERLAAAGFAPHNIVRRLAEDDNIEVARQVLEQSSVLTDADLVDIAHSRGQEHLLAMTRRERISPDVSDVIVRRGNEQVLNSIAANEGASFSADGYDSLARKAADMEELRDSLINRDDIPLEVVEKIKRSVAEKLKREFADSEREISSREIDNVVELQAGNVDFSSLGDGDGGKGDDSLGPLVVNVGELHRNGLLTEGKLREFAAKGMRAEIVHSLALKTGMDVDMAYHTLYEAEVPALAVLCRALHFRRDTFAALLQERARRKDLSADHLVRALKRYDALNSETAQRIFRFLKVRLSLAARDHGG